MHLLSSSSSDVHVVLACVDLGHLACEQALRAVAQPLLTLLGNEGLTQLARLLITIVVEVLLLLCVVFVIIVQQKV